MRSTSVGAFAGNGAVAGSHRNQAFGEEAGQFVNGAGNTFTGLAAGYQVTGDLNSSFGNSAGSAVTGHRNTALGVLAGVTVNGSYNVALGDTTGNNVNASHTVAVGTKARATANNAVALGRLAIAKTQSSVALGFRSVANKSNSVSVGNNSLKRRIVNVAPGVDANDAVTVAQLQAAVAAVGSGGSLAVTIPVAPEPPAVSVRQVGSGNERRAIDDLQRRVSQLEALVQRQQQLIAQLGSSVATAAK